MTRTVKAWACVDAGNLIVDMKIDPTDRDESRYLIYRDRKKARINHTHVAHVTITYEVPKQKAERAK